MNGTPIEVSPDTNLLGEVVAWEMKSAEVAYSDVQKALSEAGLSPDVAKAFNSRAAFTRACSKMKENRTIDKVHEDKEGKITFQLTHKEVETRSNDQKVMRYDYETQIVLDTKTGDLSCNVLSIEDRARTLLHHAMTVRNATDITNMVQKMFKEHADLFPIIPSKGVAYFVPEMHKDFTSKIDSFLIKVGGRICRWPVPSGTQAGNRSVQQAVSDGLKAVVEELESCYENWDDTTRNSTIDKGVDRLQLVEHKARVYAQYLQGTQAELLLRIESAKRKLIDRVTEITKAKEGESESVEKSNKKQDDPCLEVATA